MQVVVTREVVMDVVSPTDITEVSDRAIGVLVVLDEETQVDIPMPAGFEGDLITQELVSRFVQ